MQILVTPTIAIYSRVLTISSVGQEGHLSPQITYLFDNGVHVVTNETDGGRGDASAEICKIKKEGIEHLMHIFWKAL